MAFLLVLGAMYLAAWCDDRGYWANLSRNRLGPPIEDDFYEPDDDAPLHDEQGELHELGAYDDA